MDSARLACVVGRLFLDLGLELFEKVFVIRF